ncbi:MAG TPA: heavy metal translocating P-type ATPase, partial [Firmicutes bacterium]|nr:heavy metal translocating P-type ATPase [Bacillota bacterium]
DVLKASIKNTIRGNLFDENALMTIATLGAIAIHQLPEAVAVMLFYAVGETLQDHAVNRSRNSITSLVNIRPEVARVQRDGATVTVTPEEVEVGEEIIVGTGERIPLDGEVIGGESFVDTSALTGESVPRRLTVGHEALSGMVSTSGILTIRVTKPF